MKRNHVLLIIRVLVSFGIIAIILAQVDVGSIGAAWRQADWRWLLAALALQVGGILLSAAKWWLLARPFAPDLGYGWALGAYWLGQFASNVLPTMIGGDAIRALRLTQRNGSASQSVASVLVDRLTGFLALVLIGWYGFSQWATVLGPAMRGGVLAALLLASAALGGASVSPWLLRTFSRLPLPNWLGWRGRVGRFADALGQYARLPRTLGGAVLLSGAYQLSWVAVNITVLYALGVPVPASLATLAVPLTDIIGLAPIFLNNLGAREGVFVALLSVVGVTPAVAISAALLVFAIRLISSLGGASMTVRS